MASGNEILSYTGNAGLGYNADVPAVSTKDLDIISQTADRLQAQNAYQNHAIFAQKIKDRDQLMAAIDSGDIKVEKILDEDRDWVKEGLGALDEKHLNRVRAGLKYGYGSNEFIDADDEYKKVKREAQDRTTQAATRFLGDTAQQTAIATETLPHKREAMIKNNQEWKKNKWGEVKPYQQTLDADFDVIKKYPKKVETERTDPRNPLMKIKETTVSVPATFQEADKDFKEGGKEMYNQMELLKQYQSMRPDELGAWLTAANNRLRPHNAEIKFLVDKETGQIVIEESIPNFSAKWSMATDPQLSSAVSEFDKDLASYKLGQERNAISRMNAGSNAVRAKAYADLQRKKLSQLNDEEKRVKNFWGGVTGKVKSETGGDVVYAGDLPKGYTYIGGLDENGKPIQLIPKKTSGGREYFETRYFDSSGATTDPRVMYKEYIDFQRKNNSNVETYDALLQRLMNAGKINMELVGQNGVGNFETAGQTSRAISNKGTSKGEEPIFYDDQQEE